MYRWTPTNATPTQIATEGRNAACGRLAARIGALPRQAPDAEFSRQISGYFYLVSAKEFYGRERALVNATLNSRKPLGDQGLRNLNTIVARQATLERYAVVKNKA